MNKVVHIFKDTPMSYQHTGLAELAINRGVKLEKLSPGEHVVFLNVARDKVKIYTSGGLLSYYKSPSGKLNLHVLSETPKFFSLDTGMDWKAADEAALNKLLAIKKRKAKRVGALLGAGD